MHQLVDELNMVCHPPLEVKILRLQEECLVFAKKIYCNVCYNIATGKF